MKLNVLQLIGNFEQGGSERQAVQLARSLAERGHYRLHIACLDSNGPLRREAEEALAVSSAERGLPSNTNREIESFPLTSFYDLHAVREMRKFVRFLKREQIHIVQSHDFYTNIFGMTGGWLARVPIRIAAKRETGEWRSDAQKRAERLSFKLASSIVVNSSAVGERLISEGVTSSQIVKIYNSVDRSRVTTPDEFNRREAMASFGLPLLSRARLVTIVANMRHEVKDHRTFLKAAKLVLESNRDVRFLLAGEGPLVETLKAFAGELNIQNNCHFLGRCDHVSELLSISDVCVLSSVSEGFSNSILEYMSAGRAVVATDTGGAAEAVIEGQTGFLVPVGDYGGMSGRILFLLDNPTIAKTMGESGRRLVEQRFSPHRQVVETERLYDGLALGLRRNRLELITNRNLKSQI
ncbi:MAG TPA: glycosyltransferase [Blastocatellia bacterium]|nr:glycosyltransferase [Blastocatellia bacterium]